MDTSAGGVQSVPLSEARIIQTGERDVGLDLGLPRWPEGASIPEKWVPERGRLRREVTKGKSNKGKAAELATPLIEEVLRFPSAPIHGLHRLSQYHVDVEAPQNLHTYRVLSSPAAKGQVKRIFLMHNGLNETKKIGLYYQLASYLIGREEGTVCILRPFPSHLTRSPFQGLSETPLDHYLWDGLHLFRQFLRYMIETRWLLSTIGRHSNYRCVSGLNLLASHDDPRESRLEDGVLARAMASEWKGLYRTSLGIDRRGEAAAPPAPEVFEEAVASLRRALRFDPDRKMAGDSFTPAAEPEVHVVGYSLGGFAAQSVFMAWPFLVSSCSTLLSGGALRELAPTAFADPEEWQTVLHSLRYELDDALMSTRLALTGKEGEESVAGIDSDLFLFLKRTFYEVFQQEYRGSFQTRLVAFRQRMLFVVGGNDPIVRPQSVLDSGPPDGINMIAIGGIGHFLEGAQRNDVEGEQLDFWLPEVGGTIKRLARSAAKKHRDDLAAVWLDDQMRHPQRTVEKPEEARREEASWLSVSERLEVSRDGALPSRLFQRCLDDLLARLVVKRRGILFVLRNEIPTFLLGEEAIQKFAAASYHDDLSIAKYIQGVRARQEAIRANRDRLCVVLPWNARDIMMRIDAKPEQPSQSESAGGQMPWSTGTDAIWEDSMRLCSEWTGDGNPDAVRVFDGRDGVDWGGRPVLPASRLSAAARSHLKITDPNYEVKPSLPDCWVWVSDTFLKLSARTSVTVAAGRSQLCEVVNDYLEDEELLADQLLEDHLRIVTVSRARYNPRFRGRIVARPRSAQEVLLHAALCVVMSVPFESSKLEVAPGARAL